MWFYENRGLPLRILLLGTSMSGLIIPQIANAVIETGNWRFVFPVIALLPLCIGLPVAYLLFRDPLPSERPASVRDAQGDVARLTLNEVIRRWMLFLSVVVIALAYGGAHIHMVQMFQMHGFSAARAGGVMGIVASGIFAGRIIVGLLLIDFGCPAWRFRYCCFR